MGRRPAMRGNRLNAGPAQLLDSRGAVEGLIAGIGEPLDDRVRRTLREQEGRPEIRIDTGHSLFFGRRQLRKQRRPFRREQGDTSGLAGFDRLTGGGA